MSSTLLLTIATLALVVGPLLERVGRRMPALAAWLDGATVGGIVVVAFIHLLPEAGAHLGGWTIALFAAGLVLPTVGERLMHETTHGLRFGMGGLVLVLLFLHEVIESAALASKAHDQRIGLATLLVIVGHRLPLGLFLWGQARRRLGLAWSIAVLAFVASASFLGPYLVPDRFREGGFSAVLSALLSGGLLHLVLQHRPPLGGFEHEPRKRNAWSALGMAMAIGFFVPYLMGVEIGHEHGRESALLPERLWGLVQQAALPLCVGVLAASLIVAFLPRATTPRLLRQSRFTQVVAGTAIGLATPVRASGTMSAYRALVEGGGPLAAGLAFLVAASAIGVDSILLSLVFLGGPMTAARFACVVLVAITGGLVVGAMVEPRLPESATVRDPQPPARPLPRFGRALVETWSHLAPWMLLGLGMTALVDPWISAEWASSLPLWAQVGLLGLAGIPTYLCASAATPFAALLLAKGFVPAAVVAFLLTGPVVNWTTFAALRRMHSRKVAQAFALSGLLATLGLSLAAGSLLGDAAPSALEAREHGLPSLIAVFLLALLTLWIVALEGPRAVLSQLWPEASPARSAQPCEHADHGEHASQPA